MITIDRVQELLEEIACEFPPEFYEELNGGISLLPQVKYSPHAIGNDLYVLGEYHHDTMGRYIYIYYGSFCKVHGRLEEKAFRQELWETVAHEFTHHLESLSGERGLEIKDAIDLERYRRRYGQGR